MDILLDIFAIIYIVAGIVALLSIPFVIYFYSKNSKGKGYYFKVEYKSENQKEPVNENVEDEK